ncbi:MAG: C10 family peptidase [Kiritimatiellae bacterium]|nr:C10 family peptidase [Kiritimatiellia bacterium]
MSRCGNVLVKSALAAFASGAALVASGAPISETEALEAAKGWIALGESLDGASIGAPEGVQAYGGEDGKGRYYVVTLAGGGYVVVSGDSDLEPILAYMKEGAWEPDSAKNPLKVMLELDLAGLSEHSSDINAADINAADVNAADVNAAQGATRAGGRHLATAGVNNSKAAQRWAKLRGAAVAGPKRLATTVTTVTDGQMTAGDLRVGPLLASKWAQGDVGGAPCYNYCTPLNRSAGCVAIMAAQIMYYHKWPQGTVSFGKKNRLGADRWSYGYGANSGRAQVEIESGTFGAYEVWCNELLDANGERWLNGYQVNGYQGTVAQTAETRYTWNLTKWEPIFGGTYDWNNMLDDPQAAASNGTLTDANRLAIGHLVRDVGLTVPIRYELGGGEGSAHATLALSLVDTFQYADAVYKSGVDADVFRKGILANLDAKLPVGVTIPGHAIVADGYGYVDGVLYVHFNMGWGGGGSWYRPPAIYDDASLGGSNNKYSSINTLIYNIRPEGTEGMSIVSGRVFDLNGNVVASATVSSADAEGPVTTDAKGIYALYMAPGENRRIVVTNTATMLMGEANVTVDVTSSPYIYKDGVTNEGNEGKRTSVGNVYGVELVANKVLQPSLAASGLEEGRTSFRDTATVTFACATPGVTFRYTTDGSEPTEESAAGASVTLDGAATVKVRAYLDGAVASDVAVATYTQRKAKQWVEEYEAMQELTGTWTPSVAYENGTLHLEDDEVGARFTPNTVSATRFVVVTATLTFDEEGYDDVDYADAKAAVRIGANGCFQVFTRVGGQRKWQDVTGATPTVGATYTVKLVLDTVKKTYTATIVNGGAKRPLARNGEANFAFANQDGGGVESVDIIGESVFTSLFGRCMEALGFSIKLR